MVQRPNHEKRSQSQRYADTIEYGCLFLKADDFLLYDVDN